MGMGNTIKAIWQLLQGTTSPDVVALYNNLYQKLEGAKMGAHNGRGSIFFVNGGADGVTTGSDANDGLTPANAFLTIAHALTLCTDDNDDFIYCFNVYQQDAFPIEVNQNSVHIIGIAGPDGAWPLMVPTGDTAIFNFAVSAGDNCEIAGFSLGAGANHACIELQGDNSMVWIHNCSFGHLWSVAGQDGVKYIAGATTHGGIVEDNWFYGSECGAGKLSRCGIICENGWVTEATFRNNYFIEMPGYDANGTGGGIYAAGWLDQCSIIHNIIGGGDGETATGWAIYLSANCIGCVVCRNEANNGVDAAGKNPFVDAADNSWISNQFGNTYEYPVAAIA